MLLVVHNYYYYSLALLLIHSLRTSICVCNIYTCFLPLSMTGAAGPMTLTFPSPSPCPWPLSAALKFYIYYPLKLLYLGGWSWFQFSIMGWMTYLAQIEVYIEFVWNYASFNSNDYFIKTTHILKPQSYAHNLQKLQLGPNHGNSSMVPNNIRVTNLH